MPGRDDVAALVLSVQVSLLATLACLVPGVLIGIWLARSTSKLRTLVETVMLAPLVVPPVVTGFLLLLLLRELFPGMLFTWWAASLAAAVVSIPLLIRTVRAAVELIDPRWALVAATLGASPLRILRTITIPLSWRGIVAGATLAWARALGEFGATIVVAGNIPGRTRTIPLAIWTAIQSPSSPSVVPLVTMAMMLSLAAVAIGEWLVRRQKREGTLARTPSA